MHLLLKETARVLFESLHEDFSVLADANSKVPQWEWGQTVV